MSKNTRRALIIGGAVIAVLFVLPTVTGLLSGQHNEGWGMMGPGMMGGFGWMWFMPVLWIAVIALIVWAVVASARRSSESGSSDSSGTDSALEVLKRRYARGDIGKEEYEEKKNDLV